MGPDRAEQWDDRYAAGDTDLSWYQEHARTSVELMDAVGCTRETAVLDVGGGASALVDDLVAGGQRDVTVLDVSAPALTIARRRLGDPAGVTWIVADLLGDVTVVEQRREVHHTPGGAEQPFTWLAGRLR